MSRLVPRLSPRSSTSKFIEQKKQALSRTCFFLYPLVMKRYLIILAAALTLCACSHKGLPEGVLNADQMTAFLIDAYRLEAYNTIMYKGSSTDISPDVHAAYDDILRQHGITRKQVETSLAYYGNHPAEYKEILNEVNKAIQTE